MAKLGFIGLALAGCLALTSVNASGGILPSAFDYPEAKAFVDCVVVHAKKRVLAKGQQLKNGDLSEASVDAYEDCKAVETAFRARTKAIGLSDTRINDLLVELRTSASDSAWDAVAPIRLEQLKAQGKIR